MERETFKLVPSCFLKLLFFCVFCNRFLLYITLFRLGAKQGPREALAPGHGQTAPWPYGALVAVRTRFFRFQAARTIPRLGLVTSRLPRATRIEAWSVQGVPLGMYAPAFLSLNKKQAKSHDILKAKRLGSTDWRFVGVQNTLDPEALRLSMVPNINIPFLLVQSALETNHFWYLKSWKSCKFCIKSVKY